MLANGILAAGYQGDVQTIATIGLALFALFTGLVWAGVVALRSIALSLREIAEKGGN
jgi:hypothetical protein